MNSIGVSILTILIFVVLLSPKRWALLGMMAGVLYLTQAQQVEIAGLNIFAVRFLEIAAFLRVMSRREFSFNRLNNMDRCFLLFYVYMTVVFLLRSSSEQAFQIGVAVDAFLCYFSFRGLLGGVEEFRWFLRNFLILLAPYLLLVFFERITGRNSFEIIGGFHPDNYFRNGVPRCLGSFRHPDLLGDFGASFIPLYIGLAFARRDRLYAVVGGGLCLAIVVCSNAGGPASACAFGLLGWLFWFQRTRMRWVRRSIVVLFLMLAVYMKAPIWYLPSHVSSITGGDGWHRAHLMDMAWQTLGKWWLAGMPLTETSDWFAYRLGDTGTADITNQFVNVGLAAGAGALALFIVLLTRGFSNLGRALAGVRSTALGNVEDEPLLWGLGVMLAVHMVNWLGITYFDQMYVVWFMQLAAISSLSGQSIEAVSAGLHENTEFHCEADEADAVPVKGVL